jgi:uncharacterized protein (TIGR03437 family)
MQKACLAIILAGVAQAADFHSGQAARAVIGQTSFSARESGVSAHALSINHGRLYAAEANRLVTFDVSKPCTLCGFAPISVANQTVMRGVAGVAVAGKVVVAADTANHRVLIWRSTTPSPGAIGAKQPDVVLSMAEPVSVAYDGRRLFVGDATQHRVLVWNALPNTDDQPADAVLGKTESSAPDAATIGNPAALVSDGTNLFVADTDNRRILIFSPGDIGLSEEDIINSASLLAVPLAPGMLVTVRASGLATETEAADSASTELLPTRLADVEVYLNGTLLPLLAVSPEEIQAQLPYDLGGATAGSLYLRSMRENGSVLISSAAAVRIVPASPGIFAIGTREPRNGLLLHASGEHEVEGGPAKGAPITDESPAAPGEVVTLWASGLGLVSGGDGGSTEGDTLLPVNALVNGEPAEVLSARLPRGVVGIYEVVVALPAAIAAGAEVHLQLAENAMLSNTVIFPIKAAH